jgi:predicted Zn-dependent protease
VIRLVTLAPLDPADVAALVKTLYSTFGLGTVHAGELRPPSGGAAKDGSRDAGKLLAAAGPVQLVADDKALFLTDAPLTLPAGPLGAPPCWGFAEYGGKRAVVSLDLLPKRGVTEASIEAWRKRLAREAVHVIGHLWDLHHCYDARCAMHPSWSPHLAPAPDSSLCTFCREKSERKIRLAKT